MHTEIFSTLTTTAAAPARMARFVSAILRILVPRRIRRDAVSMPVHRRMGAWEASISPLARAAIARMEKEEMHPGTRA